MKIILLKNVDKIGQSGQVLEVKEGFARNYLIPKGLAQEALASNIRTLKAKQDKQGRLRDKEKQQAKEKAEELSHFSLTIPCQAKADEEIFGSITTQAIAEALSAEGYAIAKENVILPEPIKKLGIYNIKVRLLSDVDAEFKLWVVKK